MEALQNTANNVNTATKWRWYTEKFYVPETAPRSPHITLSA